MSARRLLLGLLLSLSLAGPCWAAASEDFDSVGDALGCGSWAPTTAMSASAWVKPDTIGISATSSRIWRKNDNPSPWQFIILGSSGQERIRFIAGWTNGGVNAAGQWDTPNGSITLGAWNSVIVTYNGTGTGVLPVIYINGVSQTITTIATPAGAIDLDSGTMTLGNQETFDRTLDGRLAYVATYNTFLNAGEILSVMHNPTAVGVSGGLTNLWPLLGDTTTPNWAGGTTCTASNGSTTASTDGPPVYLTGVTN